jgi:hypothetical protein
VWEVLVKYEFVVVGLLHQDYNLYDPDLHFFIPFTSYVCCALMIADGWMAIMGITGSLMGSKFLCDRFLKFYLAFVSHAVLADASVFSFTFLVGY